jgi:mannose-6-phosphate isomerase
VKNNYKDTDSRPWGKYFILYEDELCKIKKIIVKPKSRLSYQYHNKRSETWKIINGFGNITINGKSKKIKPGDVIEIGVGVKHRVENTGENKLVFIEIQTGIYFGEDDIVRIEDDYNRIK